MRLSALSSSEDVGLILVGDVVIACGVALVRARRPVVRPLLRDPLSLCRAFLGTAAIVPVAFFLLQLVDTMPLDWRGWSSRDIGIELLSKLVAAVLLALPSTLIAGFGFVVAVLVSTKNDRPSEERAFTWLFASASIAAVAASSAVAQQWWLEG